MGGQSTFGHCNQPLSPEVDKATSLIVEAEANAKFQPSNITHRAITYHSL